MQSFEIMNSVGRQWASETDVMSRDSSCVIAGKQPHKEVLTFGKEEETSNMILKPENNQ